MDIYTSQKPYLPFGFYGIPLPGKGVGYNLSGEAFIDAVIDERAWEFAAERTRWFDLVRLEMVEEANANKHEWDLDPIGTISKDDYSFPLPLTETLNNPNLE